MAYNNATSSESQQAIQPKLEDEGAMQQGQKKSNLIILVENDSKDKLDELFDKALNNKAPLQKPYSMRKLPPSFFNPSNSGSKSPSVSHSRENSADSAFGSGTAIAQNNPTPPVAPSAIPNGLAIHHSRAHSSPASLGKLPLNINLNLSALNLGSVTPTNSSPSPNHSNSNICTSSNSNNVISNNATAIANGTNSANLLSNLTTGTSQNSMPHNILNKTLQHFHSRGRSYDIPSLRHQLQFGELPPGWEQAKTDDGRIYYIK